MRSDVWLDFAVLEILHLRSKPIPRDVSEADVLASRALWMKLRTHRKSRKGLVRSLIYEIITMAE